MASRLFEIEKDRIELPRTRTCYRAAGSTQLHPPRRGTQVPVGSSLGIPTGPRRF